MLHVVGRSPAARVKIKSRAVRQETKSAPTDQQQQQQQQRRYVQMSPIGNGPTYPASSSLRPEAGPLVLEIMDDDDDDDDDDTPYSRLI